MIACAVPSIAIMTLALCVPGNPELQINLVWAGLTLVMTLRTLTIYLPYKWKGVPFGGLF